MPFYEYIAECLEKSCEHCYNIMTVMQRMHDDPLSECPHCSNSIIKLISASRTIIKNKEANQYKEIKNAKYWRDSNGVRHKVTSSDGRSKSPTISKGHTATPEEIKKRGKYYDKKDKKKRNDASYNKFVKSVKK